MVGGVLSAGRSGVVGFGGGTSSLSLKWLTGFDSQLGK